MKQRSRRPLALMCSLVIISLALILLPKQSDAAQAVVKLTNSNESWSEGRFFRTGLAAADIGGVQLVPTKVLTNWPTSADLPYGLSQHTSATHGKRIFVVGGNKYENSELIKSDAFFASRLLPGQSGQLEPWASQTPVSGLVTLPALPITVSDAASVTVDVGTKSYLVVLGGQRGEGSSSGNLDDVTTANIYSYEIRENANSQLIPQNWQLSSSRLPHNPDFDSGGIGRGSGARNLAAATVMIAGEPYIYIFGGWSRTYIAGTYFDEYFSDVYRSKITPGTNAPVLSDWEAVGNITGFFNGGIQTVPLAGASTIVFTDPLDETTAVYLIGGTNENNVYDANAYIAKIHPTDPNAALIWLNSGNMSETRIGHDAVQAKGSITISGGSINADAPSTSLARGFILDDLQLYRPFDNAANFELTQGALNQARMYHSMETLRDTQSGKDYAYIIGGKVQIDQNTQDPASRQVLLGDLDEPPTDSDNFVSDGKYYSKVFDFGQDAEYYSLKWKTILHEGESIQMEYRIGNDRQNLSLPAAITGQPVGGDPNTLMYTFPDTTSKARYFQFAATLKSSASNRGSSPILDRVDLDVKRVGFPNIRVAQSPGASFVPNPIDNTTTTITPVVPLINQAFDALHPTLDADWDGATSFFVDLYITPPGVTPSPPTMGTSGTAWAEISKSLLKGTMTEPYFIPSTSWRPGSCAINCSTINWRTVFTTVGTYNVYVLVDSSDNPNSLYGNIVESESTNTAGETDNISGPFQVVVTQFIDRRIFVPMTMKPPATGITQQDAPALPRYRVHTIGDSQ